MGVQAVVAVDVGGTTIKAGLLTERGPTSFRRLPTGAREGADAVVERIVELTAELAALTGPCSGGAFDIVGVGVVVPGIVDEAAGVARLAVNLGWQDVDLRDRLARRVRQPVAVGHDVRAGALAEARWGAGAGAPSALFVPIGTGIAAALVVAGQVHPGAAFQAGEIGQVHVGEGTLETIASGRSIAARYAALGGVDDDGAPVSAATVVRRSGLGDERATAVWGEAIESLADVLASAVAMVDPAVIIIGGGLSRAGAALLDPLRAGLTTRLPWRSPPILSSARFGDGAGWVGAALLARAAVGLHSDDKIGEVVAQCFAAAQGGTA